MKLAKIAHQIDDLFERLTQAAMIPLFVSIVGC
jgi:hypothetical protein